MLRKIVNRWLDGSRLTDVVSGHGWTIAPTLRHELVPRQAPGAYFWSTTVADPKRGNVRLSGMHRDVASSESLVVVVHGLGGAAENAYCVAAACAAEQAGFSCLRLALRGADRLGADLHHAGLTDDVEAALQSVEAQRYSRIYLVGYSLGGHIALQSAIRRIDPRLRAVAAICPPLDLAATQVALDSPARWIYRRHILQALKEVYEMIAQRGPVPTPLDRVRLADTLREWDALTVVPRFGFADVDDYYAKASVSNAIQGLEIPALVVASQHDPLIPAETLLGTIAQAPPAMEVRWVRGGGHPFFRPDVDLGMGGATGVEPQVMTWLERHP